MHLSEGSLYIHIYIIPGLALIIQYYFCRYHYHSNACCICLPQRLIPASYLLVYRSLFPSVHVTSSSLCALEMPKSDCRLRLLVNDRTNREHLN